MTSPDATAYPHSQPVIELSYHNMICMAVSIATLMASICGLRRLGREMDTSSEPFLRWLIERLGDILFYAEHLMRTS